MNLYLLSQSTNNGYDTFDSCVVVAESEELAQKMHPEGGNIGDTNYQWGWVLESDVTVSLLGVSNDPNPGVVCASFNAG